MTPDEDAFMCSKIAGLFKSTTTINSFSLEYSSILFLISSLNSNLHLEKVYLENYQKSYLVLILDSH